MRRAGIAGATAVLIALVLIFWPRPVEEAAPVALPEAWQAGGALFADKICDRQVECACATAKPDVCRQMWDWVGPKEADRVACLFTLECAQLCAIDTAAPECFAAARAVTEGRPK